MFLTSLVSVLAVLGIVCSRSSGPPSDACLTLLPSVSMHGAGPSAGNGGFVIATDIPLNASQGHYMYTAGVPYTVEIQSTTGSEFRGFIVQGRTPADDTIGTFNVQDSSTQSLVDCTSDGLPMGTTIGHRNPSIIDFPSQRFSWQALTGGDGLVDFRYSVVQLRMNYFVTLSAASQTQVPLLMVTTNPLLTNQPTNPPEEPPPGIVIPTRAPENYTLTFRIPSECTVSDCEFFGGIDINTGNSDYLDFYLEGDAASWVAIGFSDTRSMFSADVLACNIASDSIEVLDTWNGDTFRTNTVDMVQDVYLFSGNLSDGRISCSFSRSISGSDVPNEDLNLSQDYFVLYGRNTNPGGAGFIGQHAISPIISPTRVNAANLTVMAAFGPGILPASVTRPVRNVDDYRITARIPNDCVPSECDYYLGIDTNEGDPDFLDVYMEGNTQSWLAVGFSETSSMFDADVLACNLNSSGLIEVLDTWNLASPERGNMVDNPDLGLFSGSSVDGRIQCLLARSIAGSNEGDTVTDLRLDESYFVLFGRNRNPPENGALSAHPAGAGSPSISPNRCNPSSDTCDIGADNTSEMLIRAHGIIMLIAWPLLAVTAIFFAAWMRPALPNGEWFQVHRAFMLGSLFLGAVGFLLIFVSQYRSSPNPGLISLGPSNPEGTAHFAIGILVMILHFTNPIISIFRCHPGKPRRWIFNLLHGTLIGLGAEILALVNCGIGLALFSKNFSIFAGALTVFYVYLGYLVFVVVLIVSLFLLFTIISCTSDDEGRAKLAPSLIKPLISEGENKLPEKGDGHQGVELAVIGQKPKTEPAADERKPPSRDAPIRWGALIVFGAVALPLIIVLIILVAL